MSGWSSHHAPGHPQAHEVRTNHFSNGVHRFDVVVRHMLLLNSAPAKGYPKRELVQTVRVAMAGEIDAARSAGTSTASNPTIHINSTPPTR